MVQTKFGGCELNTIKRCRETLYKKSLCMGQALIRVSHKNKGSINLDDPVPFLSSAKCIR